MLIKLPRVLSLDLQIAGNAIQQVGNHSFSAEGGLSQLTYGRGGTGHVFQPNNTDWNVTIIKKSKQLPQTGERVLQAEIDPQAGEIDLSDAAWLRHPLLRRENGRRDRATQPQEVLATWNNAFDYLEESKAAGIIGLRAPQLGALHAIRAHWFLENSVATIVLPTGTGKTETMLATLVSVPCSKVLVIVPTDSLRAQLAEKFLTLGVLKLAGARILKDTAVCPIVCMLRHIPTAQTVNEICAVSNVIVTTSSIAAQCSPEVQNRLAALCPYLFIDEAHHAEAPTWKEFRKTFEGKRILQFTATPFREDGEPLDGKIIFKYPLKKAQEEEYFRPIRFEPVIEFNRQRADIAIAERAVARLRQEAQRGHILMARVDSVARAREVFAIYEQYTEFNPIQLHTGIKSAQKRGQIRSQLLSGHSKIVVCVDMLGEGFDLPELKIAAFHDIRKSLAVTLQLAGRFTRARPDLGDATFIANTADVNVRRELRKLYSRDPDWNNLLPELSDQLIAEQVSLQEFLRGFTPVVQEIPVRSIKPATSTVVYRTTCRAWSPENFREGIPAIDSCEQVHKAVNQSKHTLVVVTARQVGLDWTDVSSIFGLQWDLYVVIWSPEQNLLFINSSGNAGEYKSLAEAVTNEESALIRGHDVFRSFAGVTRLRLQNIGLTEQLGRNIRYIGRMGADVASALTDAQRRNARKSVYAGSGYENGEKATVGASRKGRIWSHQRGSVEALREWCHLLGAKLLDTSIDPDQLLQNTLEPHVIPERPAKMPIMAAWPEIFYRDFEAPWEILIDGQSFSVNGLSFDVSHPATTGAIRLSISSETDEAILQLEFFLDGENPNYRFSILGDRRVQVKRSERSEPENIEEFFYNNPPVIWFADGSSLEGNDYVELRHQNPPYNVENIAVFDWTGTDIQKEVQGPTKAADSIQAKVVRELARNNYDIIMDDHGKGESADVVTIRLVGDDRTNPSEIAVEFYHLKKSGGPRSGARVDDLYEVCGQAQKSILWMFSEGKTTDLFTHLLRRESDRRHANSPSRIETGTHELLVAVREMSMARKVSLKIFIVQPGLSKAQASREQLELLSIAESYLMETYQLPFGVIASA